MLEVCQPLLPPGESKNEERSSRGRFHEAASGGDLEFSLAVYGGGELCHLQPPRLRLLHFPSVGKHGGVVSGHVLHVHGASLRHLQAVRAAREVLQRKLRRDQVLMKCLVIIARSPFLLKQRLAYAITPETEHHLVDNGEVRQFTVR